MKLLLKRFAELSSQLEELRATKHIYRSEWGEYELVNEELLDEWLVKAKNLISKTAGKDSEHYQAFLTAEATGAQSSSWQVTRRTGAIFKATREDYEGGYLESVRYLTQAEVFENELEQAAELHQNGYHQAAAVIAGTVLETALRSLCDRHSIEHARLDKMNSDLAKAEIYSKLTQKRITSLADIRNNAAHGKNENYTPNDVSSMIVDVERILEEHLTK